MLLFFRHTFPAKYFYAYTGICYESGPVISVFHFNTQEVTKILTSNTSGFKNPQDICDFILRSLDADKATDIEVFSVDQNSALTDYMVVATGKSSKQVIRIAEKLIDRLKARDHNHIHTEGLSQGDWVIVDTGEVIIHLFRPEVRSFYNIEKIWGSEPAMDVVPNNSSVTI